MNKYKFTYYVYFDKIRIASVITYITNTNMFDAFDACEADAQETYPKEFGYFVGALFIAAD